MDDDNIYVSERNKTICNRDIHQLTDPLLLATLMVTMIFLPEMVPLHIMQCGMFHRI